ncbi:hypothetical protein [Noviherbaspirillum massiliense]|uniref:hypothetical protein n=1 Tax=Noviherbaspirillum massiliense TaxID=1465823 RepID=UPI0002F798D4|nr:hypothetical protein [Noviherbaspirillum massiliense]
MNAFHSQEHADGKKFASGAEDLLTALDALHPAEQQQKHDLFAKAYPGIMRAIARKVPQKDILAALSRSGLKLHPVRYREMLAEEHKHRGENGERVCCEACGAALTPGEQPTPASSAEGNPPGNGTTMSQALGTLKGDK